MATIPTAIRASELAASLAQVRARVDDASRSSSPPLLVAVSKYKPVEDIVGCYEAGHKHFGENYVAELVEKAAVLPSDVHWHFIGTLQSNKCKALASIPNLHSVQTLTSSKAATMLNNGISPTRSTRLNVLLQVNTSGEDAKSGLAPLATSDDPADSDLVQLAKHVISDCPRLHLLGLMTIGSLEASLGASEGNRDFDTLISSREALESALAQEYGTSGPAINWGEDRRLVLSMGMSSDFEAAIKAGSGIVRVGTSIFGSRV